MAVALERLDAGGPSVGITIDGLATSGPSRFTVWRQIPGQERTVVQGMSDVEATGAAYVVDYLPPLGREVRYMIDVIEGDEPVGGSDAMIMIASDTAWLQDALNPLLAVEVAIKPGRGQFTWFTPEAFAKIERATSTEVVVPMGARIPVVMASRRRGPSSVPLNMVTDAAEAGALMRELFMEGTHLVLRVPPLIRQLDAVTHLGAVDASEDPARTAFLGGHLTYWNVTGTQSRGPRVAAYTALWTYDDVADLYEGYTYADLVDGRRYVDWQAHPDELGMTGFAATGGGIGA